MKGQAGASRVIAPGCIDHHDVDVMCDRTNGVLQDRSFPERQRSGLVRGLDSVRGPRDYLDKTIVSGDGDRGPCIFGIAND